jgi:hypothetical protein
MLSHTSSFFGSVQHLCASYIYVLCLPPPTTFFPTAFPSCVFLFPSLSVSCLLGAYTDFLSGELFYLESVLTQRATGSSRTCSWAARSRRDLLQGQDTRSGQGALARRHTDGPLRAALLKTTVRCEGLAPRRSSSLF